jgi:hypothetical protein
MISVPTSYCRRQTADEAADAWRFLQTSYDARWCNSAADDEFLLLPLCYHFRSFAAYVAVLSLLELSVQVELFTGWL